MMYNTWNYWVFGLFPSSGILENRKHDFWKLDLFPSSDERGKTPTQLSPLEKANLNQPTLAHYFATHISYHHNYITRTKTVTVNSVVEISGLNM
jgi:hypothetical protein